VQRGHPYIGESGLSVTHRSAAPITRQQIAARLRSKQQEIVARWLERVRAAMPGAQSASTVVLIDSIPIFLGELADALEQPTEEAKTRQRELQMARLHGASRAKIPGYDLAQVVREYGVLRRTLFEELAPRHPMEDQTAHFIDEIIERSVIEAVVEFTRERAFEREQDHQATDRIAERGNLYAHILEAIQDHVAVFDPNLHFVYVNQAIVDLLQRPREEIVGHSPGDLGFPADFRAHFEPNLRRAFAGEHAGQETFFDTPQGRRLFEYRFSPQRSVDGAVSQVVMVTRDIDERGKAMRQLEEEKVLREQFVFALTHDLRTPLTAAKATAELLLRHPERSERAVARINHALDRANRMIQDLLDSARIRAGEPLPVQVAPCDLRDVIEDAAEELALVHGERFVLKLSGELLGEWSAPDLRRVVENLLVNAVKYGDAPSPGGLPKPIVVSASRTDGVVRMEVHNQGTPISAEEQARLFRPFSRTSSAASSGKTGWGIGLALVKAIVEAHHGKVSARSVAGEGTTFTVELPARP
jgi:PAS domain S-box-containing protein